ncbi:secreted peptidase [Streptomyces albus]|uniref:Secreted peptidase n=2 Tax=Streptomyces TaxID=1883 RepID=A0A0B5ER65_STRA4|nr:secreted peptidase [Streptomyces albus]AOU78404.1 secreted peptidase [Streptomyces albus]AYN34154.1 secreted peptidase [Streptomyces albus]
MLFGGTRVVRTGQGVARAQEQRRPRRAVRDTIPDMSSCPARHRRLRSRPLLVPVLPALLCALLGLGAPTAAADPAGGADAAGGTSGARVARLYQEAARASEAYERGRLAAAEQQAKAARIQRLLALERQRTHALHRDLGRLAREQYRGSGGLPYAAGMLLAADPEDMLRGSRIAAHANLAVDNAVTRSRTAARRLAASEREAAVARRVLDRQTAALDRLKKSVKERLGQAQWTLQGEADQAVAAGSCPGATRPDGPEEPAPGPWVAPVEGYQLSAGFDSAGAHWSHRHTGQDFAVPIGTPVRAAGAGRVVRVSCGGGFGMEIVIAHPNGYFTQYAHLASPAVDQGEQVRAGQRIGQSGTSGNSTGPHLHFEVRLTEEMGSAVDPVPWLAGHGVAVGDESGAGAGG